MQTGQPGGSSTPESSNKTPKELKPDYISLQSLERRLDTLQEDLGFAMEQRDDTEKFRTYKDKSLKVVNDEILAIKELINNHPDSKNYNPNSIYQQDKKNYYPGMSFTNEQKNLIDRIFRTDSHDSGGLTYADFLWGNNIKANDIAFVNHIRDVIRFRPEMTRIDPKDIKEFERLFPQDKSEELFGKIKEVDRQIAGVDLVGEKEDLIVLKKERKELTQQLIDDLKQHLVD